RVAQRRRRVGGARRRVVAAGDAGDADDGGDLAARDFDDAHRVGAAIGDVEARAGGVGGERAVGGAELEARGGAGAVEGTAAAGRAGQHRDGVEPDRDRRGGGRGGVVDGGG